MPIFEMKADELVTVPRSTFAQLGVQERYDLQRLLRTRFEVIAPDVLLIAEEFGEFEGARRRIDLLGLDRSGRLVVVELKRSDDGGHMELQALRYAAMVSAMTFEQAVEQRRRFTATLGNPDADPSQTILDHLDEGEPSLSDDVRIMLVAADFGVELTTSVLWLTTRHDLDIECYRITPYDLDGRRLLDVNQVIPLPEARDYQVRLREKVEQARRDPNASARDYTRYQLVLDGLDSTDLSKQQAVKQAVSHLIDTGMPLARVRDAVGNRWRSVNAEDADSVADAYRIAYPTGTHVWLDAPYLDDTDPNTWWIMTRVGGPETEDVLTRLATLAPDRLAWRQAEPAVSN